MGRFRCDDTFKQDMEEYTGNILLKYGGYSPSAERELMCLTDKGNIIAAKMYADLVFYGRILRVSQYREAFDLYLNAAGITIGDDGVWSVTGRSYPLAMYSLSFYLVNYRKGSVLKECEKIDRIENMSLNCRIKTALELALSCLEHVNSPDAINIIGRILQMASVEDGLYADLKEIIDSDISGREFPVISLSVGQCSDMGECGDTARCFFEASAREGYVYAGNNLAAKEAERIVIMNGTGDDGDSVKKSVERYINYLKLSADKYEPYAANRLGMFYINGEISVNGRRAVFREYANKALAKEYFKKATVYPDMNSAWAFYNLIKYFHKDYDNNIELMNEHMDYIKKLNTKVYDLAMEL